MRIFQWELKTGQNFVNKVVNRWRDMGWVGEYPSLTNITHTLLSFTIESRCLCFPLLSWLLVENFDFGYEYLLIAILFWLIICIVAYCILFVQKKTLITETWPPFIGGYVSGDNFTSVNMVLRALPVIDYLLKSCLQFARNVAAPNEEFISSYVVLWFKY